MRSADLYAQTLLLVVLHLVPIQYFLVVPLVNKIFRSETPLTDLCPVL